MHGSTFVFANILECDMVIYFDYEITNKGCAAKTYGPPENCYPAEAMEYSIKFTGMVKDSTVLKFYPPKYLDIPEWLNDIITEYLEDSDDVYQAIQKEMENDYGNEYEYDEDYYRDR